MAFNCPHCNHPIERELKPTTGLTARQRQLLSFIGAYMKRRDGVCPSIEEMKEFLGYASKSRVHRLIIALEERGHIIRRPNKKRALTLT